MLIMMRRYSLSNSNTTIWWLSFGSRIFSRVLPTVELLMMIAIWIVPVAADIPAATTTTTTTTIRNSDSFSSLVQRSNRDATTGSSSHHQQQPFNNRNKRLLHDYFDNINDDDLLPLPKQRYWPTNKKQSSSSSSVLKPLDLAWRNEPPEVDMTTNDDQNDEYSSTQQYQKWTKKTGTTIVGIAGCDYCILGADSRATSSTTVADKTCHKLHPLSMNCAAAGAGTSADLDHLTRECYYQMQLAWLSSTTSGSSNNSGFGLPTSIGNYPMTINTSTSLSMLPHVPVRQICRYLQQRLYEAGGTCQANLIVGGIDSNGSSGGRRGILRAIHPHGSIDVVSYTALGSGSYAAMGVLESAIGHTTTTTSYNNNENGQQQQQSHHNLTIDEAISLVVKAVKAGIDHDLGSGSQVDLCIITSNGIANYTRCYVPEDSYDDNDNLQYTTSVSNPSNRSTVENKNNSRKSSFQSEEGINGFGNVPYIIRSKRMISTRNRLLSHRNNNAIMMEQWRDILPKN